MGRDREHAIVVGGSMGGIATARVLADHFARVTVIDRDDLPFDAMTRKGVPQGRHAHALLAGGLLGINDLFPGIMDELTAAGAAPLNFNDGFWYQSGNYRAPTLVDRVVISASRPFIETNVRRRVAALANVQITIGDDVTGLAYDGARVRGVVVRDANGLRTIPADFVVDCSGRGSAAPRWLEQIGCSVPRELEVHCDVRYGTLVLRRRPSDLDGTFSITIESPPTGKRAAFLMPIEQDRWIATIAGSMGAAAPTDEASFRAIAASLPAPQLHDVLSRAEPLTAVVTHRFPFSRRRRFEKVATAPAGFVALGDAICSFNPIYGQGMSSAVLQAIALGETLARHENDPEVPRRFYRRAAKVIDTPWKMAAGGDFAYPECHGAKPAGTDVLNKYIGRVLLAAQVSSEVNTVLVRVQNLVEPPTALMRPTLAGKVLRAARRAERRNADATVPAIQTTSA
jgi:2-polyprenyl-6-methoxyphenol hydroxylase-like FAD-dependent oxidoreductase